VKSIDFRQEFEQKIAAKKALQEIQNKLNSADAQRSVMFNRRQNNTNCTSAFCGILPTSECHP